MASWQADQLTHYASLGTLPELELTEKKLVVRFSQLAGQQKEIYPLQDVEFVRVSSKRDWVFLVLGGILVAIGMEGIVARGLFIALMFVVFGCAVAYIGWIGKTDLTIQQAEGNKCFHARGQAIGLREFVSEVNAKLF